MAGGRDTLATATSAGGPCRLAVLNPGPRGSFPKNLPSYRRAQGLCPDPQELTPGPAKHSFFLTSTPPCPRHGLQSCSRLPRYCPAQFLPAISREVGYDIEHGTLGIGLIETSVSCKCHRIARLSREPLDAGVMDKGRTDRAPALIRSQDRQGWTWQTNFPRSL